MSTLSQVDTNAAAGVYDAAQTQPQKKSKVSGKVIGNPELSETGQKYYEELKKKYSNMEFILVSEDMKDQAKAHASSYANPSKMVVLIDEEKLERMATDENYRKQYEAVIQNAAVQMPQLQNSLKNTPGIKGFGMQIQENGLTSFFAVLDESSAAQKARIEKKAQQKAQAKKTAEKKEAKEAAEERRTQRQEEKKASNDRYTTITASSIEELLRKIDDATYASMSDRAQTEQEKMVGQHFDVWQ